MDIHEIQRDLNRRFESELSRLERQIDQRLAERLAVIGRQQNPRLAITLADPLVSPTYPVQGIGGGNTFPASFLSGGFTHSAGRHTIDYREHRETRQTFIHCLSQNWIPPGTIIEAWQDPGTNSTYKGKWWTPWTDNERLGLTLQSINFGGQGLVREYAPNNYGTEPAGRTWLVRNRTSPTVPSGVWVHFEQNGSVAYLKYNCCGLSGSDAPSGSGWDSGSDPEGTGSVSAPTCCTDDLIWPDNFPATLTATFSNACCAGANQIVTLTRGGGANPGYTAFTGIVDCDGLAHTCSVDCVDGQWFMCVSFVQGFNEINGCGGPVAGECVLLNLHSCNPLHLSKTDIPLCRSIPPYFNTGWCNGSIDVEITE